ncbi:MAG: PAS domain-containing protein, partial [Planctomycetaceae bacterium]|nr:PAS domain-containing protein [Planctomycetaceae bacterium]
MSRGLLFPGSLLPGLHLLHSESAGVADLPGLVSAFAAVRPVIILFTVAGVLLVFGTLLGLRVWKSVQRAGKMTLLALSIIPGLIGLLLSWYTLTVAQTWPEASPGVTETVAVWLMPFLGVTAIVLLERFLRLQGDSIRDTQRELQNVRGQLQEEQFLFSTLVNSLPDAIYFKDRESRFIRANRQVATVFQAAGPDDVVGKSDVDFFSPAEAQAYRNDELHIMQTGQPLVNKEEYEVWADGVPRWVLTTKLPLRDAQGNIMGTFGLSRDITRQKKVEKELATRLTELEHHQNLMTT